MSFCAAPTFSTFIDAFFLLRQAKDSLSGCDVPVEAQILVHHVSWQLLDHLVRLAVGWHQHFAVFCINSTSQPRIHLRRMRLLCCGRHSDLELNNKVEEFIERRTIACNKSKRSDFVIFAIFNSPKRRIALNTGHTLSLSSRLLHNCHQFGLRSR